MDATTLESRLQDARSHHRVGRLEQAESGYRRILSEFPGHAATLNLLGALLESRGESEEAAEVLQRAVELEPRAGSFYNNLGNALRSLGEHARSEAAYREALRLRPDYPRALHNLRPGIALRHLG